MEGLYLGNVLSAGLGQSVSVLFLQTLGMYCNVDDM